MSLLVAPACYISCSNSKTRLQLWHTKPARHFPPSLLLRNWSQSLNQTFGSQRKPLNRLLLVQLGWHWTFACNGGQITLNVSAVDPQGSPFWQELFPHWSCDMSGQCCLLPPGADNFIIFFNPRLNGICNKEALRRRVNACWHVAPLCLYVSLLLIMTCTLNFPIQCF